MSVRNRWPWLGVALTSAAVMTLAVPASAMTGPASGAAASAVSTSSAPPCGGTAYAPPGTVWGPESTSLVSVWGYPGYRQSYSFKVEGQGASPVAVQVKGYDENGNEQWYGLGLASDQGEGSVPWGNGIAHPALRATSANVLGATVTWHC